MLDLTLPVNNAVLPVDFQDFINEIGEQVPLPPKPRLTYTDYLEIGEQIPLPPMPPSK
jgi:hypothetical protein